MTTTALEPKADELLPPAEAAAELSALLGSQVTERTLESWRTDKQRARPLPFVRLLGAVRYRRGDVRAFARAELTPALPAALKDADRLLPPAILSRPLAPQDADRAFALLHEARGALAIGVPAPHAARIDGAIFRATEALNGLVREAARDAVVSLAMGRVAAAAGAISGVTPDVLAHALDDLTSDFEDQRVRVLADDLVARARIVALRERHRPLRDAILAKLAELQHERHQLTGKRDALTKTGALEASPADLLAAGVPAAKIAAVRQAIGEPPDIAAEVAALNQRIHGLGLQIEQLQRHQSAEPGDFSALASWPDLVALADALKV